VLVAGALFLLVALPGIGPVFLPHIRVNEGAGERQLASLLNEFSGSLAAFWLDLGGGAGRGDHTGYDDRIWPHRTRERGTDHGHA